MITNPGGAELAFNNSASVQGTPLAGGPPVTDISDEGGETDTDGDNNGNEPGENDPTPALISGLASLGDIVFEDTDGNGLQDVGEPGVGGVTVNLLDAAGNSTGRFVTTTANGSYSFDDLDAGTYIVQFIEPADRDFTTQDAGNDTLDSDAGDDGRTGVITLGNSENNTDVDAGVTPLIPAIGLAKDLVGEPVQESDGNYKITYRFVIENLGGTPLSNVGITDDFSATFNGATSNAIKWYL